MVARFLYRQDIKNASQQNPLGPLLASLYIEAMADIARMRVEMALLPLLVTLQRIELSYARVPGGRMWPVGDIRNYTGGLQRVE